MGPGYWIYFLKCGKAIRKCSTRRRKLYPTCLVSSVMADTEPQNFLRCERCSAVTAQTLLFAVESDIEVRDIEGYCSHEWAMYHLFRCDKCAGVSLFLLSPLHSPALEFGELVYPTPANEWLEIPQTVRAAYREAEKVKYHSTVAYVMLARRVLEAIAKERGMTDRTLARALSRLTSKGVIPPLLAEAAALIRTLGNAGAHSGHDDFDGSHVAMIETFLPALLEYLYVTPVTLAGFKSLLLDDDRNRDG